MPAPSAAATPVSAPAPTHGGHRPPRRQSAPSPEPSASAAAESAGDVVRWAVFCCVLVPVVLVVYGTSLGGAAGTALGLAAVTAVCRVLLRRAERGLRAETGRPRSRRSQGGRNTRRS
ncbi:hypothetical protein ACFV9D_17260 [Streptomyces sp. NPDC059875]|uniref:hypothetical protein n=1 Tax=unclassified Streptomyces TaxID=2593676 RepID=UPI003649CEE6